MLLPSFPSTWGAGKKLPKMVVSATNLNEGDSVTATITNLDPSTTYYWTADGTVSADDIVEGVSGSFATDVDGAASVTLTTVADESAPSPYPEEEGTENFYLRIREGSVGGTVLLESPIIYVFDTSVNDPPVFVGASADATASFNGTAGTVVFPAGVSVGDRVVVAYLSYRQMDQAAITVGTPAGWSNTGSGSFNTSSEPGGRVGIEIQYRIFSKTLTGSDDLTEVDVPDDNTQQDPSYGVFVVSNYHSTGAQAASSGFMSNDRDAQCPLVGGFGPGDASVLFAFFPSYSGSGAAKDPNVYSEPAGWSNAANDEFAAPLSISKAVTVAYNQDGAFNGDVGPLAYGFDEDPDYENCYFSAHIRLS